MWQNTKLTKCKIPYINNPKYKRNSILGVPIENQCVKGGGQLYGGFGIQTKCKFDKMQTDKMQKSDKI